jgi:hypothetical protein
MRLIVREPIGEYFVFARIIRAQHGEQTRIKIGQGVQILAVDTVDPLAIIFRVPAVTNTYEQ